MEISNYTNDALELLKELIAIPSVSREEKNAADKLAEYLNRWNLPFGREGNNLWVGCQDWDNNRPTIMLNAHIDTVKPVDSWTRDPFTPTQEGDLLYVASEYARTGLFFPYYTTKAMGGRGHDHYFEGVLEALLDDPEGFSIQGYEEHYSKQEIEMLEAIQRKLKEG